MMMCAAERDAGEMIDAAHRTAEHAAHIAWFGR
jgi:hypothetical protein